MVHSAGGDGAEVIYALRNNDTLSNLILNELSKQGQNIRKSYQRRLPSDQSKDYYFMQRNTGNTETVTVEYGFLDSTKDDVSQLKNNWQKYADATIKAVLEYKGISVPQESTTYIVQSGDSLWSVAKKYNINVDDLKKYNNLSSTLLSIGTVLQIPQQIKENNNIYVVQSGDTIYSISKKYNINPDELIKLNNLTSAILSINQKLIVPTQTQTDLYTVKSGDTLYQIANNFNTTIDDLMKYNNLTTNILSIGQIIKIPTILDKQVYIVQSGDSLYSISKKYNTTIDNIKLKNNLTSDTLSIGQQLTI